MLMRPSENYVLKPFQKKYKGLVDEVINAPEGVDYYLKNDIHKSMNKFN